MANTYTKIYLQLVFSPFKKENTLPVKHKEELHKYLTGVIQNRNHKLLAINNMKDHIHILIGYNPIQPLPDLVREIKAISSKFINDNKWISSKFHWQKGYGSFSYSNSDLNNVITYINNQEKHHGKISFRQEYLDLLKEFNIDYDQKYLFEWD